MEGMTTHTPDYWAVITRELAVWWTSVEGHTTDATYIIASIPRPGGYAVPLLDIDLEYTGAGGCLILGRLPRGHAMRAAGIRPCRGQLQARRPVQPSTSAADQGKAPI